MHEQFAIAHFQIGVPEYFDYASHEWRLVGGGSYYNTYMPAFAGPNLAIYIPADNSYCTFDFNHWGEANGGEIGWIRTCFYY